MQEKNIPKFRIYGQSLSEIFQELQQSGKPEKTIEKVLVMNIGSDYYIRGSNNVHYHANLLDEFDRELEYDFNIIDKKPCPCAGGCLTIFQDLSKRSSLTEYLRKALALTKEEEEEWAGEPDFGFASYVRLKRNLEKQGKLEEILNSGRAVILEGGSATFKDISEEWYEDIKPILRKALDEEGLNDVKTYFISLE